MTARQLRKLGERLIFGAGVLAVLTFGWRLVTGSELVFNGVDLLIAGALIAGMAIVSASTEDHEKDGAP